MMSAKNYIIKLLLVSPCKYCSLNFTKSCGGKWNFGFRAPGFVLATLRYDQLTTCAMAIVYTQYLLSSFDFQTVCPSVLARLL